METQSIITIAVCVAIMSLAVWYYHKACQTYDKAEEIKIKAEGAMSDYEAVCKANASLASELSELAEKHRRTELRLKSSEACLPKGYPLGYFIAEIGSEYRYGVIGRYQSYTGEETTACIKAFPFADDKDFALREAEYLLETLNEE